MVQSSATVATATATVGEKEYDLGYNGTKAARKSIHRFCSPSGLLQNELSLNDYFSNSNDDDDIRVKLSVC